MINVLVLIFQETLSVPNCGGDGEKIHSFLVKEKTEVLWNIIELFFFGSGHHMMVLIVIGTALMLVLINPSHIFKSPSLVPP